jgi:tryptophanyl-tRNA synthetase
MAADVLLYNAQYVPVGDDQTQHLEFMRDIAERMNNQFSADLFTVPLPVPKQHEFFGKDQGLRIRDLLEPTKKMSKSDETGRGVIFMSDTPEAAAKKIMSATTDSYGDIQFNIAERPGISNLLQILGLLSGRDQQSVIDEWAGKNSYGDLKKAVADVVSNFLRDFQARLATVDDAAIVAKLEKDEAAMRDTANATLLRAQKAVGLRG